MTPGLSRVGRVAGGRRVDADPRPATRSHGEKIIFTENQRPATRDPERRGPPDPARVTAQHLFNSPWSRKLGYAFVRKAVCNALYANNWSLPSYEPHVICMGRPVPSLLASQALDVRSLVRT